MNKGPFVINVNIFYKFEPLNQFFLRRLAPFVNVVVISKKGYLVFRSKTRLQIKWRADNNREAATTTAQRQQQQIEINKFLKID